MKEKIKNRDTVDAAGNEKKKTKWDKSDWYQQNGMNPQLYEKRKTRPVVRKRCRWTWTRTNRMANQQQCEV
jgi:hypothetical protein